MDGNVNAPDIGGILNGLLSNPNALSAMLSVLGNLSKNQNAKQEEVQKNEQDDKIPVFSNTDNFPPPQQNIPTASFQPSDLPKKPQFLEHNKREEREKTLLLALKPFLSKSKCETIDIFIKLLDIITLIGRVK